MLIAFICNMNGCNDFGVIDVPEEKVRVHDVKCPYCYNEEVEWVVIGGARGMKRAKAFLKAGLDTDL